MLQNLFKKAILRLAVGGLLLASVFGFADVTAGAAENVPGQVTIYEGEMDSIASVECVITYTTYEQVISEFRQAMAQRAGEITITGIPYFPDDYMQYYDDAVAYTDDCTGQEGDALAMSVDRWELSLYGGGNGYTLDYYNISYNSTKEQEEELTEYVNKALASLNLKGKDDYTKIKLIHDYICDHVDYDHEGLKASEEGNEDRGIYTAYNAAIKGKAVCQGYAILFYRMAKDAGLSCRIVTGYSLESNGRHAWNIVKLEDKYYAVDTTWDGDETTVDTYFLLGEVEHSSSVRYDSKYKSEEFQSEFPISAFRYGHTFEKMQASAPIFSYYNQNGTLKSSATNGKAKIIMFFGYNCSNSLNCLKSLDIVAQDGFDIDVLAVEKYGTDQSTIDQIVKANCPDTKTEFVLSKNENNGYYYFCQVLIKYGLYENATTFPFVFFVDENNVIQAFHYGAIGPKLIEEYLMGYLGMERPGALTVKTQPEDVSCKEGTSVSFSVKAAGTDLKYQWQKSLDGGKQWTNSGSVGATTDTLTMTAKISFNGYQFRCKITDANGTSVYTNPATLTVTGAVVITASPKSITVESGKPASFTVAATGEGLKYQWQKRTSSTAKWTNCTSGSATTATMSLTAKVSFNGYQFRCVVTDASGAQKTSAAATLTVKEAASALSFTSQPQSATVVAGDSVKFTVVARGEGLKYQWQKSTNGGETWVNSGSTGATTATLSMTAKISFNGLLFRCVVTDASGAKKYSQAATLTVTAAGPTISTQPKNQSVKTGAKVSFGVTATGTGLKYQWQKSTNGGETWVNSGSAGATTKTLSLTAKLSFSGYQFRCKITDESGKTIYTDAATLTVTK